MCWSVSLRRVCVHVRQLLLHEGPDGHYGDPFVWSCEVEPRGQTARLSLVDKPLPPGSKRVILETLGRAGFSWIEWERRNQGKSRLVRFPIRSVKEQP